jgi:hypothetical protein
MNRTIQTAASTSVNFFDGMPHVKLARAMYAIGAKHIENFWGAFAQNEHFGCVLRDCDVVSRLEDGKFAWVFLNGNSYLVQIGPMFWEKDKLGRSLKIDTEPPVCLGRSRNLGLRFLELVAEPNSKVFFYLIDTYASAAKRIRPASCFELVGCAAVYNAWSGRNSEEMDVHVSDVWTRIRPAAGTGLLN